MSVNFVKVGEIAWFSRIAGGASSVTVDIFGLTVETCSRNIARPLKWQFNSDSRHYLRQLSYRRVSEIYMKVISFLTAFSCTIAFAQTSPTHGSYEPPITLIRDEISYAVSANGSYTMDEYEEIRINNTRGIDNFSQISLTYSVSLQTLEVIEAYTITENGERVEVAPNKILTQQSAWSANAPSFSDEKVKTVIFPDVTVGAKIVLKYKKVQRKAQFPGAFSMSEIMPLTDDTVYTRITLQSPASMKMYFDVDGLEGGEIAALQEQTRLWQWTLKNSKAIAPEAGAPNAIDFSPHVFATTFPSFQEAAKAYLSRAEPQSIVTPVIASLAAQITSGIPSKREQAKALYEWVSKNIRYVAIYLDFGAVVPHAAQETAANKYGDCKDHVTLLESLLAAKGILSSPVMINAGDTFSLPKVAITPGVFNHLITYIPEFQMFVDSTAAVAQFGVLPQQERGKPALIAKDDDGAPKLVWIPNSSLISDRMSASSDININAEGTVIGATTVLNSGIFDVGSRQVASSIAGGLEPQVASRMLTVSGQAGTGNYELYDAHDLSKAYVYKTNFELPSAVSLPGPGAFSVPLGLGSFGGIFDALGSFSLKVRHFPLVLLGSHREEITTITLPADLAVVALPKQVHFENNVGTYISMYSQQGDKLFVKRYLDLSSSSTVIYPNEYKNFLEMSATVSRDLRSQIVFK